MRGWISVGFEPIGEIFSALLQCDEGSGAALAIYWKGRPVVDVWGGSADPGACKPWDERTLGIAFSCGKGLLAICAYTLVEDGRLDLDEPVGSYWPEFSRKGKEAITTRHILSHRAGLPMVPSGLTVSDLPLWLRMASAYEDEVPLWTPGLLHAYHTLSIGWLAGEVVRRVTGLTPGDYLVERIARPLGVEVSFGADAARARRVAALQFDPPESSGPAIESGRTWDEITLGSLFPEGLVTGMSDPFMLSVEIPAANVVSDARSLARVYSATVSEVDGVRILGPKSIADCLLEQSNGVSWRGATPAEYRWGTGFMLDSPPVRPMLSPRSFGHDGAGGSLGFGDPDLEVGFGFIINRFSEASYRSADALVRSLRKCLASL
jgi:CubicO group peptidase (beta-lactamase class C family)